VAAGWLPVGCRLLSAAAGWSLNQQTPNRHQPTQRLVAINVLMELVIAAAAVATGFSGYLSSLIKTLDGLSPSPKLGGWDGSMAFERPGLNGSTLSVDPLAAAAVLVITALLVLGVQQAEW
jgi:amino acid transporter